MTKKECSKSCENCLDLCEDYGKDGCLRLTGSYRQCVNCYDVYEYVPDEEKKWKEDFCSLACKEQNDEYYKNLPIVEDDELPF